MFPTVLDNTIRTDFRRCEQYFKNKHVLGIVPKSAGDSIDLIAGAAFAKGLETTRKAFFRDGLKMPQAVVEGAKALTAEYGDPEVPPRKENKSYLRVLDAFELYTSTYDFQRDPIKMAFLGGRPAIEFSFAMDLPFRNPDNNDPLIYAGRYDWTGQYNSSLFCVDEKTTGQMGARWADKWKLRAQFMGYNYAAHKFGINTVGTIVRGVCLLKDSVKFGEAIVYAKPYMLERWWSQLLRDVERMLVTYNEGVYDYDFSDGCTQYSGCAYSDLCAAQDPTPWIKAHFEEKRRWNPLAVE